MEQLLDYIRGLDVATYRNLLALATNYSQERLLALLHVAPNEPQREMMRYALVLQAVNPGFEEVVATVFEI